MTWGGTPGPLSVMAKNIPAVQSMVRVKEDYDQVLSDKDQTKIFDGNLLATVDPEYFSFFTLPLVQGNISTLFPNPNSIVLTETTAKKLYGDAAGIGKTVIYDKQNFTITGIMKDFPKNSSFHYDAILPMSNYGQKFTAWGGNGDWKTIDEDFGNFNFVSYVKLMPNADFEKTASAFTSAYKKARNGESDAAFKLQSLASVHLVAADGNKTGLLMVQVFMLVLALLLIIASINYINLSTARALARAKEVSVRKVIGAKKGQLFLQFMVETVLLFFVAAILGIVLIYLLIPVYNNLSGKSLTFSLLNPKVLATVLAAIAATLLASSIYPAIMLSSFKPIEALKGKFQTSSGSTGFRKALVVFQFAISVGLLVCTIIMARQMSYLQNKDIGYDKNYLFTVPLPGEVASHLDQVKASLKAQSAILNVAASDAYDISNVGASTGDIEWPNQPPKASLVISQVRVDKDFLSTLKMKLVEGSNFSGTPADSAYYILNETAVKQMALKKPWVGQQISFHGTKGTILGIVQDFNFRSLKEDIKPLIFYNWPGQNILYVRTTAAHAKNAIAATEAQYKQYAGNTPFKYLFLDKNFESNYASDQKTAQLFNIFAGIAIFISCLGLFGLVTYTAQVKIKEIGIRKTLGASVGNIVQLLSFDFLKLVFIAILISSPIAWFLMHKWLQSYAYRVEISWTVFAISSVAAILIALGTLSFQAIKAALANPVKSLRSE
jgi:ABC-type antimicrobial peptide transport system permease subunit